MWLLLKYWHIELAPVLLKWWSPMFDLKQEQLGFGPIWVHLPGLPLHLWSEDIFTHIGKAFGTYLNYNKSYVVLGNMSLARFLVHLDTREGLEEKITLLWKHFTRIQRLDYRGVPFRCKRCHKVSHLYKECMLVIYVPSP